GGRAKPIGVRDAACKRPVVVIAVPGARCGAGGVMKQIEDVADLVVRIRLGVIPDRVGTARVGQGDDRAVGVVDLDVAEAARFAAVGGDQAVDGVVDILVRGQDDAVVEVDRLVGVFGLEGGGAGSVVAIFNEGPLAFGVIVDVLDEGRCDAGAADFDGDG